MEEPVTRLGEITFPHVKGHNNSSNPVIIKAQISRRQVNRSRFKGSTHWLLGGTFLASWKSPFGDHNRTAMQRMGIVVSTIHEAIKFHTPRVIGIVFSMYEPDKTVIIGKQLPPTFKRRLQGLLRSNADVFAWTHTDMMGILRTIMVGGKPFNTEHKLNEYKYIKPVKQKKRGLGPDRSEAACKEVEELMKAGIL
nr:hypothetical protein [Tanacetum cinerariifolium]GEY41765.1 hypothetical protein [Tanacetum cinerariifolium]